MKIIDVAKTMKIKSLLAAAVLIGSCASVEAQDIAVPDIAPPELAAYRTAAAPVIDGKLDEPCWAEAPLATDFWKLNGTKADQGTQAQVAYDDGFLYFAFHSPLKSAEAAKAVRELPKDSIWNDETLEIFLSPFSDNQAYYHFALSPSGARFTEMNAGFLWTNPWESAVSISDNAWNAEIKIPFASLASTEGKNSPNWRINLVRGGTTWAPTFDTYHQPAKFGRLNGIDAPLADYRWLVAVGPGNMIEGPSVALQLYQQAGRTVKAKYVLHATNAADEKPWHYEKENYVQENLADRTYYIPAPLTKPGTYDVLISVIDEESGRPLAYRTTSVEGLLSARTAWNRSFYMREESAELLISSTNPGASDGLLSCNLLAAGKTTPLQTVSVRLDKTGKGVARFALQSLRPGDYEIKLTGKGNLQLDASATKPLRKLAYKAGAVQYTDEGILLRNNKPVFPFGVYYVRPYFKKDENMAAEYARVGFNTYPMEWDDAEGFIKELIEQRKNGLAPFVGISNSHELQNIAYDGPQTLDVWEKAARTLVKRVSDAAGDNIFAWYTTDEPSLGLGQERTARFDKAAREADPYHPTFLCSNNPGIFKTLAESSDILGIDPYPGFPNGRIRQVGEWVDTAIRAVPNKPVIAVLQSFYEETGRMPTPVELRCMTYLSIVHGAKGVLYFSYDYRIGTMPEKEPEAWKALQTMAGEMRTLESSLVGKPISGLSVEKTGSANVDVKLFGRSLIAVNAENEPSKATFVVQGGKRQGPVKVFGEERNVEIANGTWSEEFAPHAVHIYEVK